MKDLIERSNAIDEISHITLYRQYKNGKFNLLYLKREVIKAIKAIPAVEPKWGEWIRHENPRYSYDREQGDINAGVYYTCSECNYISWTHNYCPNCGAKMGGTDNE